MITKLSKSFFITLLSLFCLFTIPETLLAASVSGTVYNTAGTPLADGSVDIIVTNDPCSNPEYLN